ncbi:hypothetical protein GWK47_003243 [Chionoecetes opilio]|uniref:Uncharacterized protein n=1 Tax=Chionoecetes opilio TaxID=41210 RepID=A0A8J4YLQ9_CHIOP|nr:hypothetical protein GWK47_003243 [Chionoecetes opilio]
MASDKELLRENFNTEDCINEIEKWPAIWELTNDDCSNKNAKRNAYESAVAPPTLATNTDIWLGNQATLRSERKRNTSGNAVPILTGARAVRQPARSHHNHPNNHPGERAENLAGRKGPLGASALSYLPLGGRGKKPRPPGGGKEQLHKNKTIPLVSHPNQAETSMGRPGVHHPSPSGRRESQGQHGGSPRRSGTGNEPQSTRPYSTVPLPYPLQGMGGEEGQRRSNTPDVMGARGVTRIRRLDDARSRPAIPLVVRGRPVTGSRTGRRSHPQGSEASSAKNRAQGVCGVPSRPSRNDDRWRRWSCRSFLPSTLGEGGEGDSGAVPREGRPLGETGQPPQLRSPKPRSQGHQNKAFLKEVGSSSVRPKLVALQEPENLLQGPEGPGRRGGGFRWNKPLFKGDLPRLWARNERKSRRDRSETSRRPLSLRNDEGLPVRLICLVEDGRRAANMSSATASEPARRRRYGETPGV